MIYVEHFFSISYRSADREDERQVCTARAVERIIGFLARVSSES